MLFQGCARLLEEGEPRQLHQSRQHQTVCRGAQAYLRWQSLWKPYTIQARIWELTRPPYGTLKQAPQPRWVSQARHQGVMILQIERQQMITV